MMYALDLFGTLAFAISGAFSAVKHELDLLGVLTLASVTGIAGGIIRDTVLGKTPPAALLDPWYIIICILGGLAVFIAAPKIAKQWDHVMLADAIGLSVFTVIGASKAESCGTIALTVVLMGTITSCGGGLVRDLLVTEIPSILKRGFYATASLCGGALFATLGTIGCGKELRIVCTIVATFLLRALAIRYDLSLPTVKSLQASPSQLAQMRKHPKNGPKNFRT